MRTSPVFLFFFGSFNKNQTSYEISSLPYIFGNQTEFFSFQNNPKILDPSYKMDLDLWDC